MTRRRLLAATMAFAVATGGVVAAPTTAQAYNYSTLAASSWAWTDSARPNSITVGQPSDAPIGRWLDAEENAHTSRFYFSFDLSGLKGRRLYEVRLLSRERRVTDCTRSTGVEVWRTAGVTSTSTWKNPPAELEKLGTISAGAGQECPGYLARDVAEQVRAALARGESTLHLELRLAADAEKDPKLGRWLYYRPALSVLDNGVPTVKDVGLYPGKACTDRDHPAPVNGRSTDFRATASDPDQNDWLRVQFAVWPVDQPDQRREQFGGGWGGGEYRTTWDTSGYQHGTLLAFAARADDEHDQSEWTPPCYVRVDRQAPANPPQVSSAEYPAGGYPGTGGVGVPGTFRFDAGGDTDVVRYRYYDQAAGYSSYVDPPAPGGVATVTWTPRRSGSQGFTVWAIDAVGNASPPTEYDFVVRDTKPDVQVDVAGIGLPSTLTMRSPVPEVTSFGYRIDDAAEVRVPATDAAATATVTFPRTDTYRITVSAYVGDQLSGSTTESVRADDEPIVESSDFAFPDHDGVVGQEGTFTFRPRTTDVVAYHYSFNYDEQVRIPAAADGTATLTWTPPEANWWMLNVRSERADGSLSETRSYQFSVIDNRPSVYSGDLVVWPRRDGVGVPMEFWFGTGMSDVTDFVYQFDGEAEQTVAAESGSARITWTPQRAGDRQVTVRSRYASGELSPANVWSFSIWTGPVVRSTAYDSNSTDGRIGKAATFTFAPGLPGVERYTYQFEDGIERTVDAAADGTGSVTYTPTTAGYQTLTVTSRSADGTESQARTYEFIVKDDKVSVYGYYDPWSARGGIGVPGTMHFYTALFPDVVEYVYQVNDGPEQTLTASTDGTDTSFMFTPDRNGTNTLTVRQRLRDGTLSPATVYTFLVGTAPLVTSTDYPQGTWSGAAGRAGQFTFSGGTAGIVEFEYQVGEDDARVVAATDGAATISWTPPASTIYYLTVRGRLADGTWTDSTSYEILVQP